MGKIFLSSFFTEVKDLFTSYIEDANVDKTVLFIPTAANPEDYKDHVYSDKQALIDIGFSVKELDISQVDTEVIVNEIKKVNYLFISGGNTFYLLQEIKKKQMIRIIQEFVNGGKTYIGSSAGTIIMSRNIEYIKKMDNPEIAIELNNFDSIGLIDFYPLPHYLSEPFEAVAEEIYTEYKDKMNIQTITNKQAFISNNDGFKKVEVSEN